MDGVAASEIRTFKIGRALLYVNPDYSIYQVTSASGGTGGVGVW